MNRLGKISLILSLLCFLLTFGLKLAMAGWMPFIQFGLGSGLFFLFFSVLINVGYFKSVVTSESLHFVLKSLGFVFCALGLLFVLNYIVFKKNFVRDITTNKIHSLSDLSQSLVRAIPTELKFYYFHVGGKTHIRMEKKIREEIGRYKQLNDKVSFESYSVFKRPDLAQKFQLGNEESALFVVYKERIQRIADLTEAAITNALLKITKAPKKVYFVTGHKERNFEDESTFGLLGLKEQLERLHYNLESIETVDSIPEDAAIVVFPGPRVPLSPAEVGAVRKYLVDGGAVLVAVDPGEAHNINNLVRPFGIDFKNNFVFSDQAQAGQSKLLVLGHRGRASHEIAQALEPGTNPFMFMGSSLQMIESELDGSVTPVLEYLPNSVARNDLEESSEITARSPLYSAMISEGVGGEFSRLIVVGDSDFLTNRFYKQAGNFDFIVSSFSYLSKDEDLLKMRPRIAETTYLILTQTQMNLYYLFFVLPVAALFFIIALFFKLRRFF